MGERGRRVAWVAAALVWGCKSSTASVTPVASSSPITAMPVADAAATPLAPPSTPPSTHVEDGGETRAGRCKPFGERMAAGRKATVEKRYADAIDAYDDALVTVPFDGAAHAERGYAKILSGNAEEAVADLRFALAEGDDSTKASTTYNLGLAYDALGRAPGQVSRAGIIELGLGVSPDAGVDPALAAERARAYFAAAARHGSKGAAARLVGRSTCPAARRLTHLDGIAIAPTWRALAKSLEHSTALENTTGPYDTEERARKGICSSVDDGTDMNTRSIDACAELGVGHEVVIRTGYQGFHGFETHLLALPEGRLFAEPMTSDGGACRGGTDSLKLSLEGEVIVIDQVYAETLFVGGPWSYDELAAATAAGCPRKPAAYRSGDFNCTRGEVHEIAYYDAKTGRGLLRLDIVDGVVGARLQGEKATLVGDGCGETVDVGHR